jgi:hypothetical protein
MQRHERRRQRDSSASHVRTLPQVLQLKWEHLAQMGAKVVMFNVALNLGSMNNWHSKHLNQIRESRMCGSKVWNQPCKQRRRWAVAWLSQAENARCTEDEGERLAAAALTTQEY